MGVAIGRSYAQQQTLYKKFLVKVVTVKIKIQKISVCCCHLTKKTNNRKNNKIFKMNNNDNINVNNNNNNNNNNSTSSSPKCSTSFCSSCHKRSQPQIPPIQVTAKVLFGSVTAISALNAERKKKS